MLLLRYGNALQLGPDEDDEMGIVRSKDKEEAAEEEAAASNKGKGKGKKGGPSKVDVEALKREAKMDRELVQIEKLMEERAKKRQKRDEGGAGGGNDGGDGE